MVKKNAMSDSLSLPEKIEHLEREMIVDALKKNHGCQRHAAKELGLTERILGYKIKKYNILKK
ncbi:MAG: helix-turn-helix domain-containing protein [Planctomycetota bacterium]